MSSAWTRSKLANPPRLTLETTMPKLDGVPTGALCWIDLMSSDTDKSRAFYGDLFGWTSSRAARSTAATSTSSRTARRWPG